MRHLQKIDLAAAVSAVSADQAAELTFAELVRAHSLVHCDGSDLRLKKWILAFAERSAWTITSEELERAAEAMLEHGYKPGSVNRDLSAIGSLYKWAKARRLSPKGFRSPSLAVRRLEEPIRRVHVEPGDMARLRDRALAFPDRRFGAFVALLIDTGARKSEILNRVWRDVDLAQREILAPTTKNGTPRVLFYTDTTAQLMDRVLTKGAPGDLLFQGRVPGAPISYRRAWSILVAEVGLPELHLHDIRHVAAADLLRAGTTAAVAAQVLGHGVGVLVRRYGHLETAALRTAQEAAWRQREPLAI